MPASSLIEALRRPDAYPHPAPEIRLIGTHISWVLIAGEFAYKIKKPVNLGFLDFSTLDKRHFYCEEEIRLNKRLAPDIYLDVVPITDHEAGPRLAGDGPALEWAVRMHAFPADATLDREPEIDTGQIDAIADRIALFHKTIEAAAAGSGFGSPARVMHPAQENFEQLRQLLPHQDPRRAAIESLAAWSTAEGDRLKGHFRQRLEAGFVRECHGDLHLGNIAWVDGAPLIFDCIEFNPGLRFVDIISEVAFLFMDLCAKGRQPLAWRFLNRWLEHTGDYAGLAALPFYLAYRAMVRAKVALIRAGQGDAAQDAEVGHYLSLAQTLSKPGTAQLILMHGCSGTGKTWLSQQILESLGAVRLRSDVERKRLFGLGALDDSRAVPGGIYGQDSGRRTFDTLTELAGILLDMGLTVIVDATFIIRATRRDFIDLASRHGRPVHLVSLTTSPELARQRIQSRLSQSGDASEADLSVFESQVRNAEPLSEEELDITFHCDPDRVGSIERLVSELAAPE